MHCKRARTEIALWSGNDLDEESVGRLERHLAVCPACRAHREEMRQSVRVLRDFDDSDPEIRSRSVWPSLAIRLASPEFRGPANRFNGWVPAVAVAAIFLAMMTIANTKPARITYSDSGYSHSQLIPTRNVVAPYGGADVDFHRRWTRGWTPGLGERSVSGDDEYSFDHSPVDGSQLRTGGDGFWLRFPRR